MPDRPLTRDEIDRALNAATAGLTPDHAALQTAEDHENFWAEHGLDLKFKALGPRADTQRVGQLLDGLAQDVPAFLGATDDHERENARTWAMATAALERLPATRPEFESITKDLFGRFLERERQAGVPHGPHLDRLDADQIEQIAHFRHGSPPLHVEAAKRDGVVIVPRTVITDYGPQIVPERTTLRQRWTAFYDQAFPRTLLSSRLSRMGVQVPEGTDELRLSHFAGVNPIFDREFVATRAELARTAAAQGEVGEVFRVAAGAGRAPTAEEISGAVQRVQQDPSGFARTTRAMSGAVAQGLGLLATPFLPLLSAIDSVAEEVGLNQAYRDWHSDFTIAWHIAMAPTREQGARYVEHLRHNLDTLPLSEERKRQAFNETFTMGEQFRRHAMSVRGHDPNDTGGGLEKTNFLAREVLGTAFGDQTRTLTDTLFVLGGGAFAASRLSFPRPKSGREALIGEVIRRGESLPTPRARADWLTKASSLIEDLRVVEPPRAGGLTGAAARGAEALGLRDAPAERAHKKVEALDDALRRLEASDFITQGVRHPGVRERLRDLGRQLRETDNGVIERAFDVVHPDRQPLYRQLDAIDEELATVNAVAAGEASVQLPLGSQLTVGDLEAVRLGSGAPDVVARLQRTRERVLEQAAVEYSRMYQVVQDAQDVRAIAKDAQDAARGAWEREKTLTERGMKTLQALDQTVAVSRAWVAREKAAGRATAAVERGLDAIERVLDPAAGRLGLVRHSALPDLAPFERYGPPIPNVRAAQALIARAERDLADSRRRSERAMEDHVLATDLLRPGRLEQFSVLTAKERRLLQRQRDTTPMVIKTNLPEAARRALELPESLAPEIALRASKLPRNLDELAKELSADTFQRLVDRRTVERQMLERGWWTLREHELGKLPHWEKLRALRSAAATQMMARSQVSIQTGYLTQLYDQLSVPQGRGVVNRFNPLARRAAKRERALARQEIYAALRSRDPEMINDVSQKYGDSVQMRDEIVSQMLVQARKFGVLKEAEFEAYHGKPYVHYLYNPLQFKESVPLIKLRNRDILVDVDPAVLKHRRPENADLVIYEDADGRQKVEAFDNVDAAQAWVDANLPPTAKASLMRRWSTEARYLHGEIRDDLVSAASVVQELGTSIAARGMAESLKATNLVRPLAEVIGLPRAVQQNYVQIGRLKERHPAFEVLEGDDLVIHKDALWELSRFEEELQGTFSVLRGFREILRTWQMKDVTGSGAPLVERLSIAAERMTDKVLRSVPLIAEKGSVVAKAITAWKMMKIPFSYTARMAGYMGNFWYAQQAGHPMTPRGALKYAVNARRYIDVVRDPKLREQDRVIGVMERHGMIETGGIEALRDVRFSRLSRDWESTWNRERMLEEAERLRDEAELSGDESLANKAAARIDALKHEQKVLDGAVTSAVRGVIETTKDLADDVAASYGLIDSSAKYAVLKHLLEYEGLTEGAAVRRVRDYMQDFTRVPGSVRRLARSPFTPVPSFMHNAFRILGNNLKNQPLRFIKPFAAAFIWNQAAMAASGLSAEETLTEIDTRRRWRGSGSGFWNAVDLSTHLAIPVPGMGGRMMLNWQDVAGLGMFSSSNFAAGQVLEMMSPAEKRSPAARSWIQGVAIPAANMINGPFPQIFDLLSRGIDPTNGRSVDVQDAGIVENGFRRLNAVLKHVLPAGVPGTWQWEQVSEAVRGVPQDTTGKPRDLATTLLNITGVAARAWSNDQLMGWSVYLNAEEDGVMNVIIQRENNRLKELKKKFPGLTTLADKVKLADEMITREGWDAAGQKIGIRPRDPDRAIMAKLQQFETIGAARTFLRMSQPAKVRTLVDIFKMGLPAEVAGPLVGEWLTESQLGSLGTGADDARDWKTLKDNVSHEWLTAVLRAGARHQDNFKGRR